MAGRSSAERLTAVLPYYGYGRSDKKDRPRVPIAAKMVANLLTTAGADRILTIDLHAAQIQGFFDIPVDHLYAASVMIRYYQERPLPNLTVVAPDTGGAPTSRFRRQHRRWIVTSRSRERRQRKDVLPTHPERLAARDQHRHARGMSRDR